MMRIPLITAAILSAASIAGAAEQPQSQTPASFFLTQDTSTSRCQIVEHQPIAGSNMKVIGVAYSTKASAENALQADKSCALTPVK